MPVIAKLTITLESGDGANPGKLDEIFDLLKQVLNKEEKIMATQADLEASIAQINTATDTVAAEITTLQGQITGEITPAQADAINAQLGGIVTRLNSIGNPATPAGNVPPTAPTPPAVS